MSWRKFNPYGPNPTEYRMCLVAIAKIPEKGLPCGIAVGYIKRSGNYTQWIIPGIGGDVTHYNDCLGDGFIPIGWNDMKQPNNKRKR